MSVFSLKQQDESSRHMQSKADYSFVILSALEIYLLLFAIVISHTKFKVRMVVF